MLGNDKKSLDIYLRSSTVHISATVAVLVIETVARYKYLESTDYNSMIHCMGHGTLSTSMDFQWMAVPLFLFILYHLVCSA